MGNAVGRTLAVVAMLVVLAILLAQAGCATVEAPAAERMIPISVFGTAQFFFPCTEDGELLAVMAWPGRTDMPELIAEVGRCLGKMKIVEHQKGTGT